MTSWPTDAVSFNRIFQRSFQTMDLSGNNSLPDRPARLVSFSITTKLLTKGLMRRDDQRPVVSNAIRTSAFDDRRTNCQSLQRASRPRR